jgi:signal transduction histidine kinase
MFIYVRDRDDLIIMNEEPYMLNGNELLLAADEIMGNINDIGIADSRWHLTSFKDVPFLIMITQQEGVYLGACICLADAVLNVVASLEYNNVSVYADSLPRPNTVTGIRCFAKSTKADVYLFCDIPQNEVIGNMAFLNRSMIYLVILSFAIFPVLSICFNFFVSKPLTNIRNAFTELENGSDHYRITAATNLSEFSDTYDSFNLMAEKLKKLMLETLQKEQQSQRLLVDNLQLQLNFLQLQIKPHFLHNNMNFLYTLIQNNDTQAAQNLVLFLSDYFRYMFRKGHGLGLFNQEMKLIVDYLNISLLHYPEAFTFSCQLNPVLGRIRIPPLMLHGFVENIIQHALISNQVVHIIIYGEYENGTVTIQIADDGCGLSEEYVTLINSGSFSSFPEGNHVGIKNAWQRLRHCYGESASITVDSSPGNGAIFTITFPYDLTEEPDDEPVNGE